jgi:hypothetical protein
MPLMNTKSKRYKITVAMAKIYFGGILVIFGGGFFLALVGATPIAGLIALLGLLTGGVITAADIASLTTVATIFIIIGIPLSLFGASMLDEGVYDLVGWRLGVKKLLQKGVGKLPLLKEAIAIT